MTFSEFGRRPEDNDTSGTDHGTAGAQFVIGDRVTGGMHGDAPSLATTGLDPHGNLVNTVDFRQLYATVLDQWLKADSQQVLGYNFGDLPLFEAGGPGGTGGAGGPGTAGYRRSRPFRRLRKRADRGRRGGPLEAVAEEAALGPGVRVVVVRDVAHVVVDVVLELEVLADD